jgi:hypothetical protein
MNHLSELRERLQACKSAYTSAKTSLDNSLEYIVCKEELKTARFEWLAACEYHVLNFVLNIEEETEA